MTLFDEAIKNVHEYHSVFGLPVGQSISDEIRTMRSNLVAVEAKRLKEVLAINNYHEIVKALADCVYATAGTIVAFEGTEHSFSKEEAKYIATAACLGSITNTVRQDIEQIADDLLYYAEIIILDPQETTVRITEFGAVNIYRLEIICDSMQIAIISAVRERHRSNMTKLWTEDAEQRVKQVALNKEKYADITFRYRDDGGDGLVGYRLSDRKILKSPMYSKADFSPYINEFLPEYLR